MGPGNAAVWPTSTLGEQRLRGCARDIPGKPRARRWHARYRVDGETTGIALAFNSDGRIEKSLLAGIRDILLDTL